MIRQMWSMEKIVEKGLKDDAASYKPDFSVFQPMNFRQCNILVAKIGEVEEESDQQDEAKVGPTERKDLNSDSEEESTNPLAAIEQRGFANQLGHYMKNGHSAPHLSSSYVLTKETPTEFPRQQQNRRSNLLSMQVRTFTTHLDFLLVCPHPKSHLSRNN